MCPHLDYSVKNMVMSPSVKLLLECDYKIDKYTIVIQLSYILKRFPLTLE